MLTLSLLGYLNVLAIILPMGMFTFGTIIMASNSFAAAFEPFGKIAGAAAALYGCLQLLGGVISSIFIALIHEKNQTPLALILIVIGVASYFLQLLAFSYAVKHRK